MSKEEKTLRARINTIRRLLKGEWLGVEDIAEILGERKERVQGTITDLVERGDMNKRIIQVGNRPKAIYALYLGIKPKELLAMPWVSDWVFTLDEAA